MLPDLGYHPILVRPDQAMTFALPKSYDFPGSVGLWRLFFIGVTDGYFYRSAYHTPDFSTAVMVLPGKPGTGSDDQELGAKFTESIKFSQRNSGKEGFDETRR